MKGSEVEPYSFCHMKREILEDFKEIIIISDINGKQSVVTFHSTASQIIINDLYK